MGSTTINDALDYLFIHNTAKQDIRDGKVPVIVRGEGEYVFDEGETSTWT